MDFKKSKTVWFGITTLILAGLIYFAEPSRFLEALISADPLLLLPAFILGFSVFFVFTNTWHEFLTKVGLKSGYAYSFKLFMAGNFLNSVTPLGQFGGEPFMAYVINRNTDISYEKAFSTVLSGDIINGIPALTFIIGGTAYLLLFRSVSDIVLQTAYISFIIMLVGGPLVYLLWFKTGTVENIVLSVIKKISDVLGRGETIVEKFDKKMDGIQEAFEIIGEDPRHLFKTTIIAHLAFIMQIFCLYFILLSLGFNSSFTPLYFVVIISSLANFAPTPGGSGAFEATMAAVLTVFVQVSFATAITASIIFRLTTYWPGILVGYISLLDLENGEEK